MATREQYMAKLREADAAARAGNEQAKADFTKLKQIILDGDKNGTWKTPTVENAAAQQQITDDKIRADAAAEDAKPGLHWGAAGQAAMDLANVGFQGPTLGFGDEIKAGLTSMLTGEDYATAKANEDAKLNAGQVRMDRRAPGGAKAFEFLTSMYLPGASAKLLKEGSGALKTGGAMMLEGALQSGASSLGHGGSMQDAASDALLGGALGGAGGMIIPGAAKYLGTPKGAYTSADDFLRAPSPRNTRPGKDLFNRKGRYENLTLAAEEGPAGLQRYNQKLKSDYDAAKKAGKKPAVTFDEMRRTAQLAGSTNPTKRNWEVLGDLGRGGGGVGGFNPISMGGGSAIGSGVNRAVRDSPKYDPAQLKALQEMLMGGDPAAKEAARNILSQLTMGGARESGQVRDRVQAK